MRSVIFVRGGTTAELEPGAITADEVGLKAIGLLHLPLPWVPPFFVVSGREPPSLEAITAAAELVGIALTDEVLVRSSGTMEGIEERGSLETLRSLLSGVLATIGALQELPAFISASARQSVHFVIQRRVVPRKLGHLANERRLQRHSRDWQFEVEGGSGSAQSIGVRTWRNASALDPAALSCNASFLIPGALRSVAAWAHPRRAHFEWVWDGERVWVVQLDYLLPRKDGVNPADLVSKAPRPRISADDLRLFLPASADSLTDYPKLKNARLYSKLGYSMPCFYVLRDQQVVAELLRVGELPETLLQDLEALCAAPFVLRTDASGLPPDQRQMLPRSDELRSREAAIQWLQGAFRTAMSNLKTAEDVVLIGHHYIPAVASAWSLASPTSRRVRIESLWGIPEGLYCFAHDVFDVDTMHASVGQVTADDAKILDTRERYKGKFIAPNETGEWIVQQTKEGPDWSRSIRHDAWVREIAWTSRRIADAVGHDVVVMWFIGVPSSQCLQEVMPWYHEGWKPVGDYKKAAPRTKLSSSQIRNVAGLTDWQDIKRDVAAGAQVERVVIDPADSSIVRAREFVEELAAHAKEHHYVVELGGGLLSHFFYMLSKAGCEVECVDLFGVAQESIDFNKIVRDKIPRDIQGKGESVDVVELRGDALIEGLRRKLVEEALEVADANSINEMIDELADVGEVVDALMRALEVDSSEVRARQGLKREKRGGFDQGLMLVKTTLPTTLRGQAAEEVSAPTQNRIISEVADLPRHDVDFHVDHRIDASGARERQLTMTLSASEPRYSAGEHVFDLATPEGATHTMYFNARLERSGATLRLKVRLTNAAVQLDLPFDESTPKPAAPPRGG